MMSEESPLDALIINKINCPAIPTLEEIWRGKKTKTNPTARYQSSLSSDNAALTVLSVLFQSCQ